MYELLQPAIEVSLPTGMSHDSLPLVRYGQIFTKPEFVSARDLGDLVGGARGWHLHAMSGRPLNTEWHHHSLAHEIVLCMVGSTEFAFAGLPGTGSFKEEIKAGEAWAIPAFMVHRQVVHSPHTVLARLYTGPWDMMMEWPATGTKEARRVLLPKADPFFGEGGPLDVAWKGQPGVEYSQ